MPPVSYAAFVAHRKIPEPGDPSTDYSVFDGNLFAGRSYRQPLDTVPDPTTAPGLEIYLRNAGDIPWLYAWADGIVSWENAAGAGRLHVRTPPGAAPALAGNRAIEAAFAAWTYSNVDKIGVIDVFGDFIRARYEETKPGGKPKAAWHPILTAVSLHGAGSTTTIKSYLDAQYRAYTPPLPPLDPARDPADPVRKLMRSFVGEPDIDDPIVGSLLVKAGDPIGVAAAYPAAGPIPTSGTPPTWLGDPSDDGRARRITFEIRDIADQPLNPLYWLYVLRSAASTKAKAVTDKLGSGIEHPLVQLYLAQLTGDAPPPARELVDGIRLFPIGSLLGEPHGYPYPPDAQLSRFSWHYDDDGSIAVDASASPRSFPVPQVEPSRQHVLELQSVWNKVYHDGPPEALTVGWAVGQIADALQVPCEIILGIMGVESGPLFNERSIRLEPLGASLRDRARANGLDAAHESQYDELGGDPGTVSSVSDNADGTFTIDITMSEAPQWGVSLLKSIHAPVRFDGTDHLYIEDATLTSDATHRYSLRCGLHVGGFRPSASRSDPPGSQDPNLQLFYHPTKQANGVAANAGAPPASTRFTVRRAGKLWLAAVAATANTLAGVTTVTVFRNGQAAASVTIAAGATAAAADSSKIDVSVNDVISIQVSTPSAAGGRITGVTWRVAHRPPTGTAWVLGGYSFVAPSSIAVASPVRAGRDMTWSQLELVIEAAEGLNVSPGLLQTLIANASSDIAWMSGIVPDLFATLKIDPPPRSLGGYVEWLLGAPQSFLAGAARLRRSYNSQSTNSQPTHFDLPLVCCAYNKGSLSARTVDSTSGWYADGAGHYTNKAAPVMNSAIAFFDGLPAVPDAKPPLPEVPPASPPPAVRFRR